MAKATFVPTFGSKDCAYEITEYNLLKQVAKMHLTGENAFETAERVLVHNALAMANGSQTEAAKLLGVSKRVFNYKAQDFQLRPSDRRRKNGKGVANH